MKPLKRLGRSVDANLAYSVVNQLTQVRFASEEHSPLLVLYTDFSWLYVQCSQAILSVHKYVVVKVDIEKGLENRVLFNIRVFLQFVVWQNPSVNNCILDKMKQNLRLKMAKKLLLLCIQASVWSAVVQLPGKVQGCQFSVS